MHRDQALLSCVASHSPDSDQPHRYWRRRSSEADAAFPGVGASVGPPSSAAYGPRFPVHSYICESDALRAVGNLTPKNGFGSAILLAAL